MKYVGVAVGTLNRRVPLTSELGKAPCKRLPGGRVGLLTGAMESIEHSNCPANRSRIC